MWGHLLGSIVLLIGTGRLQIALCATLILASFCLGIVVYGLLVRQWRLLVNLLGYEVSAGRPFFSDLAHPRLLALVVLIALSSAYQLFSQEYQEDRREGAGDQKTERPPFCIEVVMVLAIVLLCIYGLLLE